MKTQIKYTPIALAVAVLMTSPLALANESNGNDHTFTAKADLELNVDVDVSTSRNNVDVNIEKDFEYDENVHITVEGHITPTSYSRAIVNDSQKNLLNKGINFNHDNDATASGNAMRGAAGNIGVNVAAGDNNQQDNSAAIAAADAEMTFGASDAQSHSAQEGEFNTTINKGNTNTAGASGNAFRGASGNIGANFAAGNNNQQKNNLSVSVSTGGVGLAMVTSSQESDRNFTLNKGSVVTLRGGSEFSGTQSLNGSYRGTSDQIGNLYVDNWGSGTTGLPNHPTDGPLLGHSDFDSAAQGAVDLNNDGGAFAFNEVGSIALSGTFSGSSSSFRQVFLSSSNDASLSGNAFRGASGNIGVNIASGTGNQQANSLSLSASTGTGAGGGGGEL